MFCLRNPKTSTDNELKIPKDNGQEFSSALSNVVTTRCMWHFNFKVQGKLNKTLKLLSQLH